MKNPQDKKTSHLKKARTKVATLRTKVAERRAEHRKLSPHRSFKLTRKSEVPKLTPVPVWWRLLARTVRVVFSKPKHFFGAIGIYLLLTWLVSGAYNTDFAEIKELLLLAGEGTLSSIEEVSLLFSAFVTAQTSNLDTGSLVIINLLTVLFALTFVWLARHQLAKKATTLREALYTSGTAFVPVLLLLLMLLIQLTPASLAAIILSNLTGAGFVHGPLEVALFSTLAVLLIITSLYFVTGTVVALQIAALPGMHPWRALQNARRLVSGRRLNVLRKLVMLAIVIIFGWIVLFVPAILLDGALCGEGGACWSSFTLLPAMYFFLMGATVATIVIYTYLLYRALLEANEQ